MEFAQLNNGEISFFLSFSFFLITHKKGCLLAFTNLLDRVTNFLASPCQEIVSTVYVYMLAFLVEKFQPFDKLCFHMMCADLSWELLTKAILRS